MQLLATLHDRDIDPTISAGSPTDFQTRRAARGVLLDERNRIYLMHVSRHNYHKLPGGGIDPGEKITAALLREFMEEVGCNATVIAEIGKIVEYRETDRLKQTSYCYLARRAGTQRPAALEAGEIMDGMMEVKAGDIAEAITLLEHDVPDTLEGKFIVRRDITFLRQAERMLNQLFGVW
jgi:8-oxo-dGTP diphosphatase